MRTGEMLYLGAFFDLDASVVGATGSGTVGMPGLALFIYGVIFVGAASVLSALTLIPYFLDYIRKRMHLDERETDPPDTQKKALVFVKRFARALVVTAIIVVPLLLAPGSLNGFIFIMLFLAGASVLVTFALAILSVALYFRPIGGEAT